MNRLLPALLLFVACKEVQVASPVVADPAALVARANEEPASTPVYSSFSALLRLPEQTVSLQGTLVVSPPDRFRVELRGPIGPAQVIVTCNGTDATAWIAPKNTFGTLPNANGMFGTLLGAGEGVGGAAVATSLLLGRLPQLPGTPTVRAAGSVATSTWSRDDGARFEASIDSGTAHLVSAHATDKDGVLLLDAAWTPGAFPASMHVSLPTIGVVAEVSFGEWKSAAPDPRLFEGVAPEGALLKTFDLANPQPEP